VKRKNGIKLARPSTGNTSPEIAEFDTSTIVSNIALDVFDPDVRQVTLDAPPGSGKTASIIGLVRQLIMLDHDIKIVIASPTRAQVVGLARRLSEAVPPHMVNVEMSARTDDGSQEIMAYLREKRYESKFGVEDVNVVISTVAKLAMQVASESEYHVMIIDEAYQVKTGDFHRFNKLALKQVFVGDPGQIGPVIVANESIWSSLHHRSPATRLQDTIAKSKDKAVVHYHLPETWRLGKETTQIVRKMYDFNFESARPDVRIFDDSTDVGEIQVIDVNHDASAIEYQVASIKLALHVAKLVDHMLKHYRIEKDGESRQITKSDIAVISGYRTQVEDLELAFVNVGVGANAVSILTSDRAQGSEWPIVISIDPLALEKDNISAHSLSPGRLTVMLSRHSAHLVWYGRHPEDMTPEVQESEHISERSFEVRNAIYEHPCVAEVF
jgi:hypothetical protein